MELGVALYADNVINAGLYSSKHNLLHEMDFVFKDIDLKNKRVLDIGGGTGIYSLYAACKGAERVVCLEPEMAGSSEAMVTNFIKLKTLLGLENVSLEQLTFQEFDSQESTYDVILLHNSVNHLDEDACISLKTNAKSKIIYEEILMKIYLLASESARLIICDCSSNNFFATIKMRNPFAPTIEWHKHHTPETWINLLYKVGFRSAHIKWTTFNRLGKWGELLLGHRLVAYFLISHYHLTLTK